MSLYKKRMNFLLGQIATTKILTITNNETLYTIESGNVAFEIANQGTFDIYYGLSNFVLAHGIVISSANGSKFWDTVSDNFTMCIATTAGGSTNSSVIVHEYRGF